MRVAAVSAFLNRGCGRIDASRLVHKCRYIALGAGAGAHLLGVRAGRSCGIAGSKMLRPNYAALKNKRVSTMPLSDWLGRIFMSFRGPKALNDRPKGLRQPDSAILMNSTTSVCTGHYSCAALPTEATRRCRGTSCGCP